MSERERNPDWGRAAPDAEISSSIPIPEPPKKREVSAPRAAEAPQWPATASVGTWVRRHRVEAVVFLTTVAILTGLAVFLAIDPGPGNRPPSVEVGPVPGEDITAYVAARRSALADLAGDPTERAAVVTFERPMTPDEAAAVAMPPGSFLEQAVVGDGLSRPEAVGSRGSDVFGEARSWAEQRLAVLETQRRGLEKLLASSPSPTPAAEWFSDERQRVERALGAVREQKVVMGLLVSGTGDALIALQQIPGVRLVDAAPRGVTVSQVVFTLAI